MKDKNKKSIIKNEIIPLLCAELSAVKKAFIISSVLWAAAFLVSAVSVIINGSTVGFEYTLFYSASAVSALILSFAVISRAISDIKNDPIYKVRAVFNKGSRPSAKGFAASKTALIFVASGFSFLIFSVLGTLLFIISGSYNDGYFSVFVPVSVTAFSFLFYITAVAVTSAADLLPGVKAPYRRCLLGGVLLYTLGLSLLVILILSISDIPLGDHTALILSLFYLAASLLRVSYLYFIMKKRFSRALKLQ